MVLKLYYDVMSQPSRALLLFIRANSIPCEEISVALRNGEHHTDEFGAITPFKKVPVIDHNGFILTESVAILRYLCRTYSVPSHWYPQDNSKAMAKIDEYMAWQHTTLRAQTAMYFHAIVILPLLKGEPPDDKRVARFRKGLDNVLDQIENVWLKNTKFIAGNELTIADLLAVTELEQPRMAGYDVKNGRPIIAAYMESVQQCLQPHYDEIHSRAKTMRLELTSKL